MQAETNSLSQEVRKGRDSHARPRHHTLQAASEGFTRGTRSLVSVLAESHDAAHQKIELRPWQVQALRKTAQRSRFEIESTAQSTGM